MDSLIWLGIRDMINDVRKKKLKLRPITYLSGSQGSESDIPHGYIWSPHLVPKPKGIIILHRYPFIRKLCIISKAVGGFVSEHFKILTSRNGYVVYWKLIILYFITCEVFFFCHIMRPGLMF